MRRVALLSLALVVLGGCHRGSYWNEAGNRGRYQGVGLYNADRMWAHLAGVSAPIDHAAARLTDDTQVIVVVDSQTGELRQCGNLSGHCVGMNPWAGQVRPTPQLLSKHAEELPANGGDEPAASDAAAASAQAKPAK